MADSSKTLDPLGPIDFITRALTALLCALPVAVVLLTAVFGGHPMIGNIGSSLPCIEVPQTGLTIGGTGGTPREGIVHLAPGTTQGVPSHFTLCQETMSQTDRVLSSLPVLLNIVWVVGFFLLTRRIIAHARHTGLFTTTVAKGLERLGWYILGGWALVQLVGSVSMAVVTSHLVSEHYNILLAAPSHLHWNWAVVISGFAVLSIARIMQQTVAMREEIDATV